LQYQSDYILRLIEQMGGLIRRATEKMRTGGAEEPYELADQAIGLALDMDPSIASRLSPQSLASLLELGNLDDRVVELVAQAIELEADVLQSGGELIAADVRRDQANAVRSLLGPMHAN
jgi:hypothetical protein